MVDIQNGLKGIQKYPKTDRYSGHSFIVFVLSQYDGANIKQRTIGYGWRQNQEAKLKIVGGDLSGSDQQDLDPTIHYPACILHSHDVTNRKH